MGMLKKHGRIASACLSLLLLFCFGVGVSASSEIEKVDAYVRNDFTVKFNGKTVQLERPPIMYNDYSYMSLREISQMLDMDIQFDQDTKTVYINGDIHRQDLDDYDVTGGEFTMASPTGYKVKYLGGEYPMLVNRDYLNNVEYLRLSDLIRMGVDAKGLAVSREKLTKELYVRRDEANKVWSEKPEFVYNTGLLITGEKDPDKIEALAKLPEQIRLINSAIDAESPYVMYVQVVVVDATDEDNAYKALCYSNGKWIIIDVSLRQDTSTTANQGKWFISGYSTTDLESAVQP